MSIEPQGAETMDETNHSKCGDKAKEDLEIREDNKRRNSDLISNKLFGGKKIKD